MLPTLQHFFTSILPSVGVYVTVNTVYNQSGEKVLNQKPITHLQTLIDFCELNQSTRSDCWFATASYTQGWHAVETKLGTRKKLRTQDNAMSAKALWLDIDVGDDKPYKTRQDASRALAGFIKELGLPKPWVVASGRAGLHLYFAFTEAVSKDEWQYLADRLKQACKEHGIHQDPSRTADIASILRCPLTWNMKGVADGLAPSQVQIMHAGAQQPYDYYKQILDKFTPVIDRTNRMPSLPPLDLTGVTLPTISGADYMAKYFAPIKDDYPTRSAVEVLAGCEQMRMQGGVSEPLWRGMLGTLRHCEHGRYVAHKVSATDARYDKDATDRKLDYLEDNDIAPFTCDYFRSERPEVCQRCPNNGMIKSPISVPKRPKIPTVQVETPAPQEVVSEPTTSEPTATTPAFTVPTLTLPTLNVGGAVVGQAVDNTEPTAEPEQFYEIASKNNKVNAGGCWARVNVAGEWIWQNIYPYPVYPLQRVRGRSAKGETQIAYIFRKHKAHGYDDIQIAGATLMGQTLNATLGEYGFLLNDKERKLMAGLLIDLLKETENTIGEVQTTDRLGWNENQDTFLLGNKLYKTDGKVFEVAVAGKAKVHSQETVPKGSLSKWKEIANIYNRDGMECFQVAVATAFASPLAPLGSLENAAMVFLTGEAGIGKSTALMLGTSVYGHPKRMQFNKSDTPKARIHKLGVYSNIAASFDEMTEISPKEASELAYTLTQGRGHNKMGSGGEDLIENTTYWSCIPVMSANDSIISALSQHGNDPTAQMSRVLEIKGVNINKICTPAEVDHNQALTRQLLDNYGTAGDVYIRYLTQNKEQVLDMIYQIEKRFVQYAELNTNYRFWTFMCTRMIVGVMIANKLGLLNYNVAKLFAYLVKAVKRAKADLEKYKWTPETMVAQFMGANLAHRLTVVSTKRPEGKVDNEQMGALNDINYVVQAPAHGREITMRYEQDTGECIISILSIKQWCKKAGVAYTEFMRQLEAQYEVVAKRSRRELGRYTVHRGAGTTECVIIKIPAHLRESE